MSTEIGQTVLPNAEEVPKPEPGDVISLLLLTAVLIVRAEIQKLSHVTFILVKVMIIHELKYNYS